MAQYTKLLGNEIREIARRYLLELTSYEPIQQGVGNSNYLLNTKEGKYILTIFEIEPKRVRVMCDVLAFLESNSFPAPRINYLPNGNPLADHHGKPVLMKPYIAGGVIDDINGDQATQLGKALANLHALPTPDGLQNQHNYVVENLPVVIEKGADQVYIRWLKDRYRIIMANIPSGLPCALIHGDLFTDNVLFEDGNFKAILDFEDHCHYYKVFDLGMGIVGLCREKDAIALGKAREFIRGYQEIRRLEAGEREILQAFSECTAILTSVWRYWKNHIDLPDVEKSNKYLEMVNIAKHIAAIPKAEFQDKIFG